MLTANLEFTAPHPNLDDRINHNIIQSEIEGGVFLRNLQLGTELEVETEYRIYRIVYRGESKALISGHPKFCPEPVLVNIHGSTWGGSMIKPNFLGRGMHLEFQRPEADTVITTSRILEIRELDVPVEAPVGAVMHSRSSR